MGGDAEEYISAIDRLQKPADRRRQLERDCAKFLLRHRIKPWVRPANQAVLTIKVYSADLPRYVCCKSGHIGI